jgi:hypothetical protein
MKNAIDLIQILLTELGPFSFIVAMLLAWAVFQASKLLGAFLKLALKIWEKKGVLVFNPFTRNHAALLLLIGALIYLNGERVSDGLQYFEQAFVNPTAVSNDTSFFAESRFEEILKRHTNEAQFLTVRDSTRALANEIGCRPQDIYLVAYSECGVNPFRIRDDGVAAGWIQFTRNGLNGLGKSLHEVKQSCRAGDAKEIMRLTGCYIRRAANGRKITTAADFYCAVFAPAKMSAGIDDVLYSGYNNPEYYLNAGLDGYFVEGEKVLYLPHRKDGRLTKRDLQSALEYKKAKLLLGR